MFTIKTRYAFVLSLLLGVFAADVWGEALPEGESSVAADSLQAKATDADTHHNNTIDPFTYRLQGRYLEKGADYYSDSIKWFHHVQLGMFSGLTLHGSHVNNGVNISPVDRAIPVGFTAAYNFNRLHGIRLLYSYNKFSHNPRVPEGVGVNELGIGYMLNLTNYFKGYNPKKRLNVYSTLTAVATRSKDEEGISNGARGELGLLFDYRFWKRMSFYIEPYFGASMDNYDRRKTPHRYDFLGGVRAGVAVNSAAFNDLYIRVQKHKTNFFQPRPWWERVYFGTSAGKMWTNAEPLPGLKKQWIDSHVFLGYRFSPIHSLRFQATYFKNPEPLERKHHVMGELDYVINFTNMWRGYYPNRRFRVSGFFGMGSRYIDKLGHNKAVPMVTAGFDLNFYLTHQISLFAEPYAGYAFPGSTGKSTLFGGVRGGIQVDLIETYTYMPHFALTQHEREVASQWKQSVMSHFFFGMSGGYRIVHTQPKENHNTYPLNAFVGYRFTPVQSLRLQTSYIKTWENIAPQKHVSAELDYMVNFSNLFYGYKPKRILNISGYVGAGVRNVVAENSSGKVAKMFTSGLDVSLRMYKGINFFVEPYAALVHQKSQRYYVFDVGVNGGISVNLEDANFYGKRVYGIYASSWQNAFWRHLFVGAGGGPMWVHTNVLSDRFTTPMNLFVGYRFTPNQAIRLKGMYIRTFENLNRERHIEGEVDYMLNFTNLFANYKHKRLLNVIGFVGVGAKYLDNYTDRDGKLAPMATMGVDLALRIKKSLSVFAEPYMSVSKGKHQDFLTKYFGVNAGLALNMEEVYAYSPFWGTPSPDWIKKPRQRLFFGVSGGWLRTQFVPDRNAMPITFFAGYRFSPIHALRMKIAWNGTNVNSLYRQYISGGIDYMFNATNLICGYNPRRPINFIGFVGLGVRDVSAQKSVIKDMQPCLMGNAGMDIAVRLTRNVNLYLEPYVGAVHAKSKTSLVNFFMGANGGVVVNLENIDLPYGKDKKVVLSHNPFFEGSYGWVQPLGNGMGWHGSGLSIDGRLGVWIDPIFGVRASVVAENYGYSKHYESQWKMGLGEQAGFANATLAKARIEGLFSPLNLSSKWRNRYDYKKFDLNFSAGVEVGVTSKKFAIGTGKARYRMFGLTGALQALYKFSPSTAIYLEPRYEYMNSFYKHSNAAVYAGKQKDKVVTLSAGVRIMRGTLEQREFDRRLNFDQYIIMGVNLGGYKAIAGYKIEDQGGRIGTLMGINLGFILSPLHGVKLTLQPSWYKAKMDEIGKMRRVTFMDERVVYMLNLANLYQDVAKHKVDAYIEAGGILSTMVKRSLPAEISKKKTAFGASMGFLISYNINKRFAITTEPMGNIFIKKGYIPGYAVKPHMGRIRADITFGTMVKL